MAAEIIAEDIYRLSKVNRGNKGLDSYGLVGENNRTVQVKAWPSTLFYIVIARSSSTKQS